MVRRPPLRRIAIGNVRRGRSIRLVGTSSPTARTVAATHSAAVRPSLKAAYRTLLDGALMLAAARGHDVDIRVRDGVSTAAAECRRCAAWLLVTTKVMEGGQDPVTGKGVRQNCPRSAA